MSTPRGSQLRWETIKDFRMGIVNRRRLPGFPGLAPAPLGAASEENTWGCIALPGGGLGPLPAPEAVMDSSQLPAAVISEPSLPAGDFTAFLDGAFPDAGNHRIVGYEYLANLREPASAVTVAVAAASGIVQPSEGACQEVAYATGTAGGTISVTVTLSPAPAVGEFVLFAVAGMHNRAGIIPVAITQTAGPALTVVRTDLLTALGRLSIWSRIWQAGDAATATFQVSEGIAGNDKAIGVLVKSFAGVSGVHGSAATVDTSADTTLAAPNVVTTVATLPVTIGFVPDDVQQSFPVDHDFRMRLVDGNTVPAWTVIAPGYAGMDLYMGAPVAIPVAAGTVGAASLVLDAARESIGATVCLTVDLDIPFTYPAGIQAGDVLLMFATVNDFTASANPTLGAPSGWTTLHNVDPGTDTESRLYKRVAASALSGTQQDTFAGSSGKVGWTTIVAAFRNVSDVEVSSQNETDPASNTITASSVTTVAASSLIVWLGAGLGTANGIGNPTGYSVSYPAVYNGVVGTKLSSLLAVKDTLVGAGAVGAVTATIAGGAAAVNVGYLVALTITAAAVQPYSLATDTLESGVDILAVAFGMDFDAPSPFAETVLARGPVAYWRLGESAGTTAQDSGPNNHDGTYINTPTLGVAGLLTDDADTAVTFTAASSERVEVANHADFTLASGFSVEAIFTPVGVASDYGLVDHGANGNPSGSFNLLAVLDQLQFALRTSAGAAQTIAATVLSAGVRCHALATYDNVRMRLYANGVEVDSAQLEGVLNPTTLLLMLAARNNNGTPIAHLDGTLDECVIYPYALTPDEVLENYKAGSSATHVDRVGRYLYDVFRAEYYDQALNPTVAVTTEQITKNVQTADKLRHDSIFGSSYLTINRAVAAASNPFTVVGQLVVAQTYYDPETTAGTKGIYLFLNDPNVAAAPNYEVNRCAATGLAAKWALCFTHQGRVCFVVHEEQTVQIPPRQQGYTWYSRERMCVTLPNYTIMSTVTGLAPGSDTTPAQFVFVPEVSYGYGTWGSLSASDLFLVKQQGGAVLCQGDVLNPTVRRLPSVASTRGTECDGALTSLGFVYGVNHGGVYAWAGGDTSRLISAQLDDDFWQIPSMQAHQFPGRGTFATWDEWVLCPNNWLCDTTVEGGAWWRIMEPTGDDDKVAYWAVSPVTNAARGCTAGYTADVETVDPQTVLWRFRKTDPASAWSWESAPIPLGQGRLIQVKEATMEAQGDAGATVTLTFTDRAGAEQAKTFTLVGGGQPEKFRANFSTTCSDLIARIEAAGADGPAPVVYEVGFALDEHASVST